MRGGVFSTALDMARFGQMFLNVGRYGEKRILSPATVAAMTRNQIPGVSAFWDGEFFPEASWGYGWDRYGAKKAMYEGVLCSPEAIAHGGAGGVKLWVDPRYELVAVYFSGLLRTAATGLHPGWTADLFINAATAAVTDESGVEGGGLGQIWGEASLSG